MFIETQVGTYLGEDDVIRYEDDYIEFNKILKMLCWQEHIR